MLWRLFLPWGKASISEDKAEVKRQKSRHYKKKMDVALLRPFPTIKLYGSLLIVTHHKRAVGYGSIKCAFSLWNSNVRSTTEYLRNRSSIVLTEQLPTRSQTNFGGYPRNKLRC